MKVGGVVLFGGQSSRMGRSKAWLPFGADTMLERVVNVLRQVVTPIVVVAAAGEGATEETEFLRKADGQVRIVRDEQPGQGPLMGLAVGLAALTGHVDAAFVTSCDAPFLQPALVRRLVELLGDYEVCLPRVEGREYPLTALYRGAVAPVAQRLLGEDRRRVGLLAHQVRSRWVAESELADVDPGLVSLVNVNTPEEYTAALRFFSGRGQEKAQEKVVQNVPP